MALLTHTGSPWGRRSPTPGRPAGLMLRDTAPGPAGPDGTAANRERSGRRNKDGRKDGSRDDIG